MTFLLGSKHQRLDERMSRNAAERRFQECAAKFHSGRCTSETCRADEDPFQEPRRGNDSRQLKSQVDHAIWSSFGCSHRFQIHRKKQKTLSQILAATSHYASL